MASPRTATSSKTTGLGLSKEELSDFLRQMYEIRFFEEKVAELLKTGVIKGASHLYAGEEAVAVGAISAITEDDVIASTHRGHGHCGAIGRKHAHTEEERQEHWNKMMAELMGKATGYCKGRGGSMHIADVAKGNLGSTGIVGGNIPIGTGAAFAEKYKGTKNVVLCFFGDGASNTGSFHESLNMGAALLGGLPIVYICENNLYGMSVPFHDKSVPDAGQASKIENVADRASAYGIPGEIVDGMDVLAVREAVLRAVERARRGEGPTLIEAKTYRWFGHSISDQRIYRTKDEEAEWKCRCPIECFRKKLLDAGILTEAEADQIRDTATETIEKATKFAMESPYPDPSELYDDVYVPIDIERWEAEKIREKPLLQRVHSIEAEMRRIVREQSGGAPKAALPKLNKEAATKLEEKYGMPIITYGQAIVDAQREEMKRDPNVFVMGEDVGLYGGAYAATRGLYAEFGPKRVIDTAISEAAIAGAAAGAAMRGTRPISEIMYIDFTTIASDQIVHNMAYNRYMFGGKTKVPTVLRTEGGVGRCIAAHHSESLEAWFVHIPGLYVVMPSTPYDAKGLLKASIRDDNPVIFIEHKVLYSGVMGPVPAEDYIIPLGVADVKREGTDATIVAYSRMLHFALDAALELEKEGINVEVVDPRTLNPLDVETIANSVRKTGRLITVSEGYPRCGVGETIIRQVSEYRFSDGTLGWDYLDAPPIPLSGKDVPIPMSEPLEDACVPTRADIIQAVKSVL
ncbi:MAG: alpha-ketoacid dehydrogenase subunit alpha/beta [Armatimonadota bacterium]